MTRGRSSSRRTERPTKGPSPPMPPSARCATASLRVVLRGNRYEVLRFVDAPDANATCGDIDFIDAARILRHTPVSRKRLVEKFEQQGAVHTVMADQHDGFVQMARQHHPQCIRRTRHEILQRLAVWEAHQMWGC